MTGRDHLLQDLPVNLGVHMYMYMFLGRGVLASRDSQGDYGSKEVKDQSLNLALSSHKNGNPEGLQVSGGRGGIEEQGSQTSWHLIASQESCMSPLLKAQYSLMTLPRM